MLTSTTDEYIKSKLPRGIYRALDYPNCYIAQPGNVISMDISVDDIKPEIEYDI